MAQSYPRKTLSVFGAGGTTDDFEEFGSTAVAATNYTKDIATIQALAAWTNGWRPALVTAKAPILQDMNAVQYVHSYMQGSVFEEGIPEWDAGTTYSYGSVVKLPYTGGNNFQIFISLADGNTNNALPTAPASNGSWQFVYGFISGVFTMGTSMYFGVSTQGITGTKTNDSAATGVVGEYVAANASGTPLTAGTWVNLANISLTAGDWDVQGLFTLNLNAASVTLPSVLGIALSQFSGNTVTDQVLGVNEQLFYLSQTSNAYYPMCIPRWRVSTATTTTVYIKGSFTNFTGASPNFGGSMSARRMR
jgi:hypothetical protein